MNFIFKKMFNCVYWESRIFTQFKCVFSVKIHNFLLGHWFDLKSNCILLNNDYHFYTFDFVAFFSYWKSVFFLSKNLCKCMWCFWKYLLLKKFCENLSFPFIWILPQLSIVPFPRAWWAVKLLTYDIFPWKRSLKQESDYVRSNPSAVPTHSTETASRFTTHSSPTAWFRVPITHQLQCKSSEWMLFQKHGYWINQRKSQLLG